MYSFCLKKYIQTLVIALRSERNSKGYNIPNWDIEQAVTYLGRECPILAMGSLRCPYRVINSVRQIKGLYLMSNGHLDHLLIFLAQMCDLGQCVGIPHCGNPIRYALNLLQPSTYIHLFSSRSSGGLRLTIRKMRDTENQTAKTVCVRMDPTDMIS